MTASEDEPALPQSQITQHARDKPVEKDRRRRVDVRIDDASTHVTMAATSNVARLDTKNGDHYLPAIATTNGAALGMYDANTTTTPHVSLSMDATQQGLDLYRGNAAATSIRQPSDCDAT